METIHGAPSFTLRTAQVELAITQTAGHLGPVTFHLPGLQASPYSLSPWQPHEIDQSLPNLLTYLRGDFMCLPFGGQEKGPPHGDTANAKWDFQNQTNHSLVLRQKGTDTGATVTKTMSLVDGHHAIYAEHVIAQLEGRWNYGNHPILNLFAVPGGTARIATSAFRFGSVYHAEFSNPAAGESGILKPNSRFTDLRSVTCKDGTTTDLTRYPARPGNDDLIMLVNAPATEAQPFAWTAVTFPEGYVWYQLKNVADFPSTLFWLSNGGRPGHPWEKRHLGRLGLEEVCSHFCDGVDIAREDRLAADGVPTSREFRKDQPVRLPLIQAAAAVGPGFGQVQSITPAGPESVRILGENGQAVTVPLNWHYLKR